MTDYEAWERFDLETALEDASDAEEEEEDAHRERRSGAVQSRVIGEALRAAAALDSHVRVARLRATERSSASLHMDGDEWAAFREQAAAAAAALERQQTRAMRVVGPLREYARLMHEAEDKVAVCDEAAARLLARAAGACSKALRAVPEDEASEHGAHADCAATAHDASSSCAGGSCCHGAEGHNDERNAAPPADPLLQRATLRRAVTRAQREAHLQAGSRLRAAGRLAEASEVLRDVLLQQDGGSARAWVARGELFAALRCPLLARLHFETAVRGARRQRRVKAGLAEAEAELRRAAPRRQRRAQVASLWRAGDGSAAREAFRCGKALFEEGFFASADLHFAAAADAAPEPALRAQCLVASAACCAERRCDPARGSRLCSEALEAVEGGAVRARVLACRARLATQQHRYGDALSDLAEAQRLAGAGAQAGLAREEALARALQRQHVPVYPTAEFRRLEGCPSSLLNPASSDNDRAPLMQ